MGKVEMGYVCVTTDEGEKKYYKTEREEWDKGTLTVTTDGKSWGLIDQDGVELCELKYDSIQYFWRGYAKVSLNGKEGWIDRNGKEICPVKYDRVDWYHNGFAPVMLDGVFGFVDESGKEICKIKYDAVLAFDKGYAAVKGG